MSKTCPGCGMTFLGGAQYRHHGKYNTHGCSQQKRFWGQVDRASSPEGCWLWTGIKNERGYGLMIHNGNRNYRVHRFVWEIFNGPTPSHRFCLHKCDVRNCVNPDHMYLGSYQENIDDMLERGRDRMLGERNAHATLTDEQVMEIRRDYKRYSKRRSNTNELAARYGVSRIKVYLAAVGLTWAHLPGAHPRNTRSHDIYDSLREK